jgi:glutathione S-transferase
MIKIYGSPKSSAGRVYWMLEELGLTYEAVQLDMRAKEHKSEKFLKLNPNGKVPCLTDGDYAIWESMAINSYLADKYQSALLGKTPEARGLVQQWSYWSILELQKHLIEIFIQKVFVPDEKRDLGVIEKAKKAAEPLLAILDHHLVDKKFLVGDAFTLADLNVASVASITEAIQMDVSHFKHIQHWQSQCKDRPAYQKYLKLMM